MNTHRFHTDMFNLGKLNEVEGKYSLGYYELKNHKPWFNTGCLKIIRSKETR
jgi:hypothetical protein